MHRIESLSRALNRLRRGPIAALALTAAVALLPLSTACAGGRPGVIVIHEWWGLNDNVETMARMLAHQGYAALAVDLYGGESAETPENARALMQRTMDDPEPAKENLRQAHAYLTGELGAPATGVIGWCFGGGWSLQTALMIPELDAAVMYYGRVVTDPEELRALDTPLLGIFGAEDEGIPVDQVREMEAALGELGKDATIHVYEGAGHAFANPSGTRYQPEAAKDAWEKTVAFFDQHLTPGS
jgi:carboxymethylenebutenolidase